MEKLDITQIRDWIDTHFTHTAFRLETFPAYAVPSDGGDVARYLAGEPEPDPDRKGPWLDHLRGEAAAGKARYRVRTLCSPLNGYLRYECEWGYMPNAKAGETIRVIDLAEQPLPREVQPVHFDWHLLDEQHLLRMHYDGDGTFLAADATSKPSEVEKYRLAAAAAWNTAVPFVDYWAAHPQFHRANQPQAA